MDVKYIAGGAAFELIGPEEVVKGPNKKIKYCLMSNQLNDKIVIDFSCDSANNVLVRVNWITK